MWYWQLVQKTVTILIVMAEQGEEKTEEPTPQKLRKAREKGQISKSQDLTSAIIFIGCLGALVAALGWMVQKIMTLIILSTKLMHSPHLEKGILDIVSEGGMTWLMVSLPIVLTAFLGGLIGNYAQVGFLFTMEPLKPKANKISPINGLKQMFSMKRFVELIKQVVKFAMVSAVVYYSIKGSLFNLVNMQRLGLDEALPIIYDVIRNIFLRVSILFFVIAIADFFFQRYSFRKSMRMTKYEVKQEYKESEGDPQLKSERKHLAQELVMHGSQQSVKKADAVITNPNHYAVAIRYSSEEHGAPIVVAKGMNKNAQTIKEIAKQYGVPILRNVSLAQALHKLDLDEEVPEELYDAIAEVLNFVYELRNKNG